MQPLFASLFLPNFAAAVLTRGERRPAPLAVVEGAPPNQFVCAVNAGARRGGVRESMPLAEARARFSYSGARERLRIADRDSEAESRAQKQLLALAETVTPRFEDSGPGLITLDFAGLRDAYASSTELSHGVEKLGFQPNLAVSRNRFTALCAARTQPGVTHIYPGQEAGFLKVQPLDALPLEERERETLMRWGLRTIGDLAALEETALVERFGLRGSTLARLSRGEAETTLEAYSAPPLLEERESFDWEIGELEPLSFALSGMLERLCLKLTGYNLAAARLKTTLELTQGGVYERKVDLTYPMSDPRTLLTLVRLDLAAHPPGDAITGARVAATPAQRRMVQFALFTPDQPSPEKLAVTLARLSNLVGERRVGAPVAPDTHKPGAAAVAPFAATAVAAAPGERERDPATVFRTFRPPWSARMEVESGKPAFLETPFFSGAVEAYSGPWRICGEWWTENGWQFEEWDVEVSGRLYRACCDRQAREWHVTGEYD